MAQDVALLSPDEQAAALEGVNWDDLLHDWRFWGRPTQLQLIDELTWTLALFVAGRGAGKTRSCNEWAREKAKTMPGSRGLLVARTAADVRDVIVNGESGLLHIGAPSERPEWEPSKRLLTWPNGTTALCFSSEAPSALRGPQGHWTLCDELASWAYVPDDSGLTAWDQIHMATRLSYFARDGRTIEPQIVAATTPKRTPFMRQVLESVKGSDPGKAIVLTGSTYDNAANLARTFLDKVIGLYEGTTIGRQELEGQMLDDVEGALWTMEMIDRVRVFLAPMLPLRVVAVDPSVAEKPRDECGIVVVGSTVERELFKRHAYVLEDATVQGSPDVWANAVVSAARRWGAPVVAEVNQGGDLVRSAIHSIDSSVKVYVVHSRHGKKLRAEPITLCYEQGRVHHVGFMPLLEDQLTTWDPERDRYSPDRLDAVVHGLTALLIKQPEGLHVGGITASSPARRRIPVTRGAARSARVFDPGRRRAS